MDVGCQGCSPASKAWWIDSVGITKSFLCAISAASAESMSESLEDVGKPVRLCRRHDHRCY